MKNRFYRWLKVIGLGWALMVLVGYLAWLSLPSCDLYREGMDWSQVLRDRDGKVLHVAPASDGRYRIRVRLSEVAPSMIEATCAHEDQRYHQHLGVDGRSMLRAVYGVLRGKRLGGGSTITMQYARIRFDLRTRDIGGKCEQMLRAWQLERHFSKDQILEAYFNCAPYGKSIEGIEAASLRWCGKRARQLHLGESVALVMVPQRPVKRCPVAGEVGDESTQRARMRLLKKLGFDDPLYAQYAWQGKSMPRQLMHLSQRYGKGEQKELTIDSGLQSLLESEIQQYLTRQADKGVRNGAVMVVHAPTRQVRACVSSGGFFQPSIQGQLDGLRLKRSPGSLYKPFLYGLAIDQGLIYPDRLLADAPAKWVDYNPENYERDFLGPIRASDALMNSRNLPALQLMTSLSPGALYEYLKSQGVSMEHDRWHYGMSLVLGSAPATMEEIASLYCGLYEDGRVAKVVYEGRRDLGAHGSLSDAARWLVVDMLRDRDKDALLERTTEGRLSIKTGTSQGFKDAWAVGMTGEYVVVGWLGNFDGSSSSALKGRTMAAPMVREVVGRLGLMGPEKPAPNGVERVCLCAVSGMIAGESCRHVQEGWYLPGVSPIQSCDIHRKVWIDEARGIRVSPLRMGPGIREEIMEFWNPEFMELFRLAGLPRQEIPPYEEEELGGAPRILSPVAGSVYQLGRGTEKMVFKARGAVGVKLMFWFLDGQLIGSVASDEVLEYPIGLGEHRLRLIDDQGRKAEMVLKVGGE